MTSVTATAVWSLEEIAAWAAGTLVRPAGTGTGARVSSVTIDTRTLEPGALFVPLPGSRADGHEFIATAFARGAAASFCSRERARDLAGSEPGPLVVVDDVTVALQRFAARHRAAWGGELFGITGSAGKTTTKDLVAAVLEADRPTLKTAGNLNNHWGVPLTLLRLRSEHRAAVVEMGMNHPGEIGELAALARPTSAVITNAGTAHLEFMGSVEAIAREKASLAFALHAGQVAFAGADSPQLLAALVGARARVVAYGLERGADVHPNTIEERGKSGTVIMVSGFPPIALQLVGLHQVRNALAALAVSRELGLDPERTALALGRHQPAKGRMEVRVTRGATLLLDHYNANPDSTRAALETLARWPHASRRLAILGDMLELGALAPELHRAVGAAVRDAELWTVGRHAEDYAAGARPGGIEVRVFPDKPALAAALRETLGPGLVVLVKGSRGAALEQVIPELEEA